MKYEIISTGSKGNAVVLNDNILIDCGVSFKALHNVYKKIKIVLLTHSHGDHFKTTTIKRLAKERPSLRFASCEWLTNLLLECNVSKRNIDVLNFGKVYDYGLFKVSPVKLYHNVPNCGYRVFVGDEKAIYATDTNTLDGITAQNYDLYLIESNYEDDEIQERIKSKQEQGVFAYEINVLDNHLSKEKCDKFIYDNMGDKSQYVYLHEHEERARI